LAIPLHLRSLQKLLDLLFRSGEVSLHRLPDFLQHYLEVLVNENIARGCNPHPGCLGVGLMKGFAEAGGHLQKELIVIAQGPGLNKFLLFERLSAKGNLVLDFRDDIQNVLIVAPSNLS
jgi:hypothetical protein